MPSSSTRDVRTLRSIVYITLAIVLIGVGGGGGWYLRGRAELYRGAQTAVHSVSDGSHNPTVSASTSRPNAHKDLERFLSTAQYQEAVALFRALVFDHGFDQLGWASELFFYHAQRLEILGTTRKATRLLRQYLAIAPQDVDAYILLADIHHRNGRTGAALEALANASNAAYGERQEELFREFDHILRTYVRQHRVTESDPVDEALLERLAQALPYHEPLYLELARRYSQIEEFDVAVAWLHEVDPNGKWALQRARLLFYIQRQLEQEGGVASQVFLQRLGRHYLVDVTIIDGDDEADLRLMIDTGASLTLVTPEAAERLAIVVDDSTRRQQLATPGGLVDAPLYQIEALAVGREIVWDLPIAIVPLDIGGGHVDGLIGMDFLGKFEFTIDQDNQELTLTRRE